MTRRSRLRDRKRIGYRALDGGGLAIARPWECHPCAQLGSVHDGSLGLRW